MCSNKKLNVLLKVNNNNQLKSYHIRRHNSHHMTWLLELLLLASKLRAILILVFLYIASEQNHFDLSWISLERGRLVPTHPGNIKLTLLAG